MVTRCNSSSTSTAPAPLQEEPPQILKNTAWAGLYKQIYANANHDVASASLTWSESVDLIYSLNLLLNWENIIWQSWTKNANKCRCMSDNVLLRFLFLPFRDTSSSTSCMKLAISGGSLWISLSLRPSFLSFTSWKNCWKVKKRLHPLKKKSINLNSTPWKVIGKCDLPDAPIEWKVFLDYSLWFLMKCNRNTIILWDLPWIVQTDYNTHFTFICIHIFIRTSPNPSQQHVQTDWLYLNF